MRKDLPPRYYLSHFHEFLAFFEGANSALLSDDATDFVERFKALDDDKQCIVVRAANRKYAVIDRTQFNYGEITEPQAQIDWLIESGWFGDITHATLNDIAGVLTKDALLALLAEYGSTQGLASLTKPKLVTLLNEHIGARGWPERFSLNNYLVCLFDDALRYLLFLYFGNTKSRLNQFSMRDLGVMRTRSDSVTDTARFDTKSDAEASWFYANHYSQLAFYNNDMLLALAEGDFPATEGVSASFYRDQLLYSLGLKVLAFDRAKGLDILKLAQSDKAKEKWPAIKLCN